MKRLLVAVIASLSVVSIATFALLAGKGPTAQKVTAAEPSAFDASKDFYISRNPKIELIEGVVTARQVKNSRNHPDFAFSRDPAEATEQRSYAAKNHFQAEFSVRVDRWISGSGPQDIIVVKGVSFQTEEVTGPHITFSGAWDESQYESISTGRAYRIYLMRHSFMSDRYYALVGDPESVPAGDAPTS